MTAIALALGASACWGVGDFLGGLTSRRLAVLTVLAVSQLAGLTAITIAAFALGGGFLTRTGAAAAAAAGVAGLIGLAGLYRGMAIGAMSIVAPISASAAALPLAVGLARGERPSQLQLVGVVLALAGVVLVSLEPGVGRRLAAGVPLALVAAAGFGSYFLFIERASADDAYWAVVVARLTSASLALAVAVAVSRDRLRVPLPSLPVLVAIGVLDVGANLLLALALNHGLVSLVSVLASLYPVIVVALAIAFLSERPRRSQALGGGTALAGVALIAAYS